MTKLKIDPGICGMLAAVSAHSDDGETVRIARVEREAPAAGGAGLLPDADADG